MALPNPETCRVLRDGQVYTINLEDRHPGDVDPPEVMAPVASLPDPGPVPAKGWASLTAAQLAQECTARSLAVPSGARKADLVALLESVGA